MKDGIREAFDNAIADADARENAEAEARKQKSADRQRFENDYIVVCEGVIVPALREVMTILQAAGWKCEIADKPGADSIYERFIHGRSIALSIYKAGIYLDSKTRTRPRIKFGMNSSLEKVFVHEAIWDTSGPSVSDDLSKVTHDFVQNAALNFFKKLSSKS
jgi:hypothetical protein